MSEPTTISVTTGPQRGKVFEITQELIHIGTAPENEIVIDDDGLHDHQASIVRRDNRFAIFAPDGAQVEIDGSAIPAERWVWLPASAMIKLGGRTTCQFQCHDGNGDEPASGSATASVADLSDVVAQAPEAHEQDESEESAAVADSLFPSDSDSPSKRTRSKRKRRSGKRKREVARFLTDTTGDALVQLGEDGTMPELTLEADSDKKKDKEKGSKESNPLVMYVALGLSFLMSLSLLVIEFEPSGPSSGGVATARQELADTYYGIESKELEPYQRLLRTARFARSRGDRTAERRAYRNVLSLLNSEDKDRYTGLTGTEKKDARLKELIAVLLED